MADRFCLDVPAGVVERERSFWAADRCMQIHGGMGLSKELPIERFFRDQRSMMITEGAIEVLRMALARMILDVR